MARPRYNRPTDAELQTLAVLWKNPGGQTVRQIYIALKDTRGSGYNSVLKIIQIMHAKGIVTRDDSKRPQEYFAGPSYSRISTGRLLVKDLLTRVFDGDADAIRTHLDALKPKKKS